MHNNYITSVQNENASSATAAQQTENSVTSAKSNFYEKAEKYWSTIPATLDGVLGGFGSINTTDIQGSREFLNEVFHLKSRPQKTQALDCGAGIGRTTKELLMPIFEKVDIVEQDQAFCEKAKESLGSDSRLGTVYNLGLQSFVPDEKKYDIVWCQWVLGHLTNEDLIEFFKRINRSLVKGGLLLIKENVTSSNKLETDDTDSSVTRPLKMYKTIIRLANFKIIKLTKQTNFPRGLYPVYMFACKPIINTEHF